MSWKPEVDEIHQRYRWAEELGGSDAVAKHHAHGRFTVRERIAALVDAGSFQEIGKLAGHAKYEHGKVTNVMPAPYVMGLGKIDGRLVAIGGEDFTVRGGTATGSERRKGGRGGFVEDLAYEFRVPLVNLIDGAGGSVDSVRKRGYTTFPGSGLKGFERSVELLARVPVVCAVMGAAAGGPAARAVLSHFSVMVRGSSQIFAAGPPVVERAFGKPVDREQLGGAKTAVDTAGTIDSAVESEAEACALIKRFLSYLPQNVWSLPPVVDCDDPPERREEALLDIVPRDRRKAYNMRQLITLVVDCGSPFELQPTYGRGLITMLARLAGKVVGIVANNPMAGGIMDVNAARKQTHFIDLCDTFHIPLIFFVDVPGVMIGDQAESAGILREGMRAAMAGMQATVPILTLVIRRCYGMAGMATRDRDGLDFKIAWPSAEWGSLPIEGGVTAAYRREIEAAGDRDEKIRELEAELKSLASPLRTAEAFAVEDVIDPRETRPYLCGLVEAMQERLATDLGMKPRYGVRP
ncbi:MAG: propionyl-CoA carboxylase [Betaproteobacteria bacterium RIFCSPLOWO2_12_FULL_62_58]|nr:MAG: propionyl-CoA carboxylase [Betaproteobacteria bacterium RIFCSPLOWO2_12_FULL_62_58]